MNPARRRISQVISNRKEVILNFELIFYSRTLIGMVFGLLGNGADRYELKIL